MVYGYSWLEGKPNPTTGFAKQEWTVVEGIMPPKKYPTRHSNISNTQIVDVNEKSTGFAVSKKCGINHPPNFFALENRPKF